MAPSLRNQRGSLLTPSGSAKLAAAIHTHYQAQNLRVTSRQIAQTANLPVEMTLNILYRQQNCDLNQIKSLFRAFDLKLKREDFETFRSEDRQAPPTPPEPLPVGFGRGDLLMEIKRAFQGDGRLVVITGMAGIGKSTAAQALMGDVGLREAYPWVLTVEVQGVGLALGAIARQVLGETITQETQRQGGVKGLIGAITAKLESKPCLLWIEGLTLPLSDAVQQLLNHLGTLPDMRSRLLLTLETLPPNLPDQTQVIHLKGLALPPTITLFQYWGVPLPTDADHHCLETIHQTYQGHPLALKMIAGEIRSTPYNGNIQAYWRDYGYEYDLPMAEADRNGTGDCEAMENLGMHDTVPIAALLERASQRLAQEMPLAYELLTMGATQRGPAPVAGWQFLIADLDPHLQAQAFETLSDRFWLETVMIHNAPHYRIPSFLHTIILNSTAGR